MPPDPDLSQVAKDATVEAQSVGPNSPPLSSLTDANGVPRTTGDPALDAALAAFITAGKTSTTTAEDPDITRGRQAYVDVWGIDPPKGYIESLVKMGMNPYEIRAHELAKTDASGRVLAKSTNYYRDDWANKAAVVAQAMGRR